jgi:hypothetical protein
MYWGGQDPKQNLERVPVRAGERTSDYLTGVILCCGLPRVNATGVYPRDVAAQTAAYRAANLTVHLTLTLASPPNASDFRSYLALQAQRVDAMADAVAASGARGVVVDYEPEVAAERLEGHAAAYADFLSALSAALFDRRLEAAADLSDWGILDKFPLYAERVAPPLAFVTTMGGWYHAGNHGRGRIGGNWTWLETETDALLRAFRSPQNVHLGLSDQCRPQNRTVGPSCGWTPALLARWTTYLRSRGAGGIDVWAPDHPDAVPSWQWDAFRTYLAAGSDRGGAVGRDGVGRDGVGRDGVGRDGVGRDGEAPALAG